MSDQMIVNGRHSLLTQREDGVFPGAMTSERPSADMQLEEEAEISAAKDGLYDVEALLGPDEAVKKVVSISHGLVLIIILIGLSCSMIVCNKWIYSNLQFPYPLALTAWHLAFSTISTQALALTTNMLKFDKSPPMTLRRYYKTILPISILFLLSLGCGNMAYLYLTVSFIQMLKASAPIAVLLFSWSFGLKKVDTFIFINIFMIAVGVFVASIGEATLDVVGILLQAGGIIFEAIRLVSMEKILMPIRGKKMNALILLYYYAPSCAIMNIAGALVLERDAFSLDHVKNVGWAILLANAILAFMMNIITVVVIDRLSGLAITLAGVFRTVLVVISSVIIFGDRVSWVQVIGFPISTVGLAVYQLDISSWFASWSVRGQDEDLAATWIALRQKAST